MLFLKVNPTISLKALSGRSTLTEYTDKPTTANGGSKRESNANHTLIRRNPCLAPHVYTFDVERLGDPGVEITLHVRWTVFYFYRLKEPILQVLYGAKAVSTLSAITPPKVSQFG